MNICVLAQVHFIHVNHRMNLNKPRDNRLYKYWLYITDSARQVNDRNENIGRIATTTDWRHR